ncbi:aminotransferase class IV family protein [Amycolatopsis sp. BJA-103]|uniref:aminotransferase class IV family protein n=1 Tax=unclassified Amycolatopsis TaxID=2618356 RepID=UPI000C76FB94|nr:aminotransferase class IV family protein [Amycolatopsis sp. BJA-103]AUI58471.1 aminodeoxychorismate lyase [Amycolatopsis sp. BJA-103]PNE15149.1 aminodeoxychorismate lyase [Amycolatopsis sp. BJA-103]
MKLELNGAPARSEDLVGAFGYGHFTAMQVRDGKVRGLDAHLHRLATSTRRMFATGLDTDAVRGYVRQAVRGEDALSVRVLIFSRAMDWSDPGAPAAPDVLVRTGPPKEHELTPLRLRSVRYERVLPEVKHVGTFGLVHHTREAMMAGYDDALFVDQRGRVSEASIWNVGFLDGGTVVWPQAPVLDGITQQLVRRGLTLTGIPQEIREVRPADLPEFDAMFLTNSESVGWPVASVDDVVLPFAPETGRILTEAYESNPWDEI